MISPLLCHHKRHMVIRPYQSLKKYKILRMYYKCSVVEGLGTRRRRPDGEGWKSRRGCVRRDRNKGMDPQIAQIDAAKNELEPERACLDAEKSARVQWTEGLESERAGGRRNQYAVPGIPPEFSGVNCWIFQRFGPP